MKLILKAHASHLKRICSFILVPLLSVYGYNNRTQYQMFLQRKQTAESYGSTQNGLQLL